MGIFSRDRSGTCAACGRTPPEVKLIKGPRLGICEACAESAATLLRTSGPPWRLGSPRSAANRRATERCSFCGKRGEEVGGLVELQNGTICPNCIALCKEVFAQAPGRAAT
jgi:hypothetical protein